MNRRIILSIVLIASVAMIFAQSRLHDLDIRVVISKHGDARITEAASDNFFREIRNSFAENVYLCMRYNT